MSARSPFWTRNGLTRLSLCLPLVFLAACDETDAVAVRVRLSQDLSGTLTTTALVEPADGGSLPGAAKGATWTARASLLSNAGSFERVSELALGDLEFAGGTDPSGMGWLQVTLPRGAESTWAKLLVPLDVDARAHAARALDPSGKSDKVGDTIRIEVTLPSNVVGNGLTNKSRGMKIDAEAATASLIVPLDAMLATGEPLVWHVTWRQP